MKLAIIFTVALMASLAAMASDVDTVTLRDGQMAKVLRINGKSTTYIKSVEVGADGTQMITPDQVFAGEKVAKKADGTCVLVRSLLISLDAVQSGDVMVQVPTVQTTESVTACKS
jgi:hypothetical protein